MMSYCSHELEPKWLFVLVLLLSFPILQPVEFLWNLRRQFEKPKPPWASAQQDNTTGSLLAGGPDTTGQPHATREPLEV